MYILQYLGQLWCHLLEQWVSLQEIYVPTQKIKGKEEEYVQIRE